MASTSEKKTFIVEFNENVSFSFRDLSSEMAFRLLQTFYNVYASWWNEQSETFSGKKRSQTRLIQLVYDLRFIHLLLERKDNVPVSFSLLFFNEFVSIFVSSLGNEKSQRELFQINRKHRK